MENQVINIVCKYIQELYEYRKKNGMTVKARLQQIKQLEEQLGKRKI